MALVCEDGLLRHGGGQCTSCQKGCRSLEQQAITCWHHNTCAFYLGKPSASVAHCNRYPKAWAERAEDAKAKEKRLRALLHEQRMRARASFSARVPF